MLHLVILSGITTIIMTRTMKMVIILMMMRKFIMATMIIGMLTITRKTTIMVTMKMTMIIPAMVNSILMMLQTLTRKFHSSGF